MILPENYENIYSCINTCGATSKIYVNSNYTEVYKVYLGMFKYHIEKMNELLKFSNPNVFTPIDLLQKQNSDKYVGYVMDFDVGKSLSKLIDAHFSNLISATLDIPKTLEEISKRHFLIIDPNVDNITFSTSYKFVDVYSFLWAKKFSYDCIFQKNLKKVNISVLCGLLGFSYPLAVEKYFRENHSKYLERISNLNSNDIDFLYQFLSIIQEEMQTDSLQSIRQRLR